MTMTRKTFISAAAAVGAGLLGLRPTKPGLKRTDKIGFLKITNISSDHQRSVGGEQLRLKVLVTEDDKPWSGKVAGFSRYRPSTKEIWDGHPWDPAWKGPFDVTRSDADGIATVVFPGQDPVAGSYEIKVGAMV